MTTALPSLPDAAKPRLVVLTDLTSILAHEKEPDDGQSMIRLLHYACDLRLEGLIASSNLEHGHAVRPDLLHRLLDAYAATRPALLRHRPDYPAADVLRGLVAAGQPIAGRAVPPEDSFGRGRGTAASARIIAAVDAVEEPLWVSIWGGSADLAQALWEVREQRSPDECARFVAKLRVHAVYDQDSTGPWIKATFPDLFVITRNHGIRGMYRGGDRSLVSPEWVGRHIRGHGPLADLYPEYDGGDVWSRELGRVRGIKEGDTPSFLGLLPNGLGRPDRPELGGWGGRCASEAPQRLVDVPDGLAGDADDRHPAMAAIHRWRSAFQRDFQARLDWAAGHASANRPPTASIAGPMLARAAPGDLVHLDGRGSRDPDGSALAVSWSAYPPTATSRHCRIEPHGLEAEMHIAQDAPPGEVHVLLAATDAGDPPLTGYARVTILVG